MDNRFSFFVSRFLFLVCGIFSVSFAFAQTEVITADTINHNDKTYFVIPKNADTLLYENTTYLVIPEMADKMRKDGKIYIVVAICLTILIGLFIYVFLLDRRINRLEKGKD
ncbi:MAG TPA: hypothetical protein VK484_05830 [Ferruginibacter sp.]|nr:hypothetical protein [Ferruginibacter sp.]